MRHWLVRGIAHPRCNSRAESIILRVDARLLVPVLAAHRKMIELVVARDAKV